MVSRFLDSAQHTKPIFCRAGVYVYLLILESKNYDRIKPSIQSFAQQFISIRWLALNIDYV